VRHADGSSVSLWLEHSSTAAPLDWFRTGSALNTLGQK